MGIATCSTARILSKDQVVERDGDSNGGAEEEGEVDNRMHVVGNKTEAALLILAQSDFFHGDDYEARRINANFDASGGAGSRMFPFSSKRKRMSVLVKNDDSNKITSDWTLYHKGAGEIVLRNCSTYLDADGSVKPMTPSKRSEFELLISKYASQALRCVALAHKNDIGSMVKCATCTEQECEETLEKDMCLDAMVGIVDPLRGDVVEAVKTCQLAGIFVRMVTGDNLETANAIAKQAGILTKGECFVC
jgi:magnesium-transporting ATPase (P-type)